MGELKDKLFHLYYTPYLPSSFGPSFALKKSVKKKDEEEVEDWLRGEDAYTLHKPVIRKFKRRPTLISGGGEQVQIDLMDVKNLKRENDGKTFILTAIDVFSKKAWAFPLKNKSGVIVAEALKKLFSTNRFRYMQTDKGTEFFNPHVKKILKEFSIHHFTSENETIKAAIVERFNQTLKNKMYRYFTFTEKNRYVDVLDQLVLSYNNKKHSSTGFSPNQVNLNNEEDIWMKQSAKRFKDFVETKKNKNQLEKGDYVRISKARSAFQRGYTPNWTEEIFIISEVKNSTFPSVYRISDQDGEEVQGRFYGKELQKVKLPEFFKIEKVIRERKNGRKKEVLVKWKGYPESFNSWIDKKGIH